MDRKIKPTEIAPVVCKVKVARGMLGDCGEKQFYELLKSQEIESYKQGRARRIVVASIHAYVERKREEARRSAAKTGSEVAA